jgi:hypothetical protein
VKHNKKKNFSNSHQHKKSYSHDNKSSSSKGKAPMKEQDHVPKSVCRHCKREGHYMKDCVEFLNGDLYENVYMAQPKGFNVEGKENLGCHITKFIYGLKQASRQ